MSERGSREASPRSAQLKNFSINVGMPKKRGLSVQQEQELGPPGAKRPHQEDDGNSSDDSTSSGEGELQIDTSVRPDDMDAEMCSEMEPDSLTDLPERVKNATSRSQFVTQMRPFLWVKYPSATSAEINSMINAKWNMLREVRKEAEGNVKRNYEVKSLGGPVGDDPEDEVESGRRSTRRRAAKNLARNVYTLDIADEIEYTDSPASSTNSKETTGSGSGKRQRQTTGSGGGSGRGRKRGRRGIKRTDKKTPRVPPMKIKVIGRSGESDSPIFFAESVESWDEGSDSEHGGMTRRKNKRVKELQGLDSETSSLVFGDRDDESTQSETSDMDDEEAIADLEEVEAGGGAGDSEGEHADFCHTCKDGGELLCCDFCPLAYHLNCLVPPMNDIPDGDWKCPRCEAKKLPGKAEKLLTWHWKEITPSSIKKLEDGTSSELEDDVMMEEGKQENKEKHKIREFLVKWQGKSYWKCSWVSELRLDVFQPITLRAYTRKHNMDKEPHTELAHHIQRRYKRRSTASHVDEKLEEQEMTLLKAGVKQTWLQIHRVINKRVNRKGTQYLVKWRDLSYSKATWEELGKDCGLKGAEEAIQSYEDLRKKMDPKKMQKKRGKHSKPRVTANPEMKYKEQPDYITKTGGTLHPYQLEGLNWLRFSWSQKTNTILADEMGLGKTIQTISFLNTLVKEGHSNGPFLVSAPLSTIVNWEREFEFWAPDLYVVTYNGDKDNRAIIRENEFSFVEGAVKKSSGKMLYKMKKDVPMKFHVLLTSYEFISVDSTVLQSISWEVLVVDEAHRLKNNQSKFFRVLSVYDLKYKLLLTGTPLQNNLEELFHLLNFLNPQSFNSLEQFQEEFEDISKEDQVSKLHELLAPHLLRRLKTDVLKDIPSKRELIVRVELSAMQKKYYRWILTRNFEKLNTRGAQPVSLLNIMMDLKKCCNHPYLFPTASVEAPLTPTGFYEGRSLVQACGKFIVLSKMLKKLKVQGHRVLIFSQMTRMLDILEDFLEYLGYQYERIDGNVTGPERQQSIDRFNMPNSPHFVFLLSTRAGGLGINLATADTVIIYDSDWNPHNDIQAFSRAHRIGQSNKVMIYRFVTRGSVEERITEVAKRKMMLTHLVVRPGMGTSSSAPSLTKREMDDILRFGTEELFKEDNVDGQGSTTIHYDDKAIDALLDRDQEGEVDEGPGSENLLANEYLSSFKVASYVMKEKEAEAETEVLKEDVTASQQPDPDFWEKLLRHHYEQQKELEAAKLGKGKRIRKQVNYLDAGEVDRTGHDSDQSSYKQSEEDSTEEESDDGDEYAVGGVVKKTRKREKQKASEVPLPPLLAKNNENLLVLGFNPRHRKGFLNSVMRYGMPPPNAFHTKWRARELKSIPENAFNAYVNMFMRHLCEPDNPDATTYTDDVPKETVSRQNILTRIGIMRLVRNKIEQYAEINGEYSIPGDAVRPEPVAPAPTTASSGQQPANQVTTTVVSGQQPVTQVTTTASSGQQPANQVATTAVSGQQQSAQVTTTAVSGQQQSAQVTTTASSGQQPAIQVPTTVSSGQQSAQVTTTASLEQQPATQASAVAPQAVDSSSSEQPQQSTIASMEEVKEEERGVKVESMETTPTGGISDSKEESRTQEETAADGSETSTKPQLPLLVAEEKSETHTAGEERDEKMETEVAVPSDKVKSDGTAADVGDKVCGDLDITEAGSLKEVKEKSENVNEVAPPTTEKPRSRESSVIVYTPPSKAVGGAKPAEAQPPKATAAVTTGVPRFMFNIADGGFTELHSLWADEKTKGFSQTVWGRHHDYWLLKGIVTHGYCRWSEMCNDIRFNLLNKPFGANVDSNMSDSKSRFMLKRFKLLEQALAVEEQLHRASNAGLVQDPNHSVMQLHSRFTDLDCLADGHVPLVADCLKHKRNSILLMKKALGKMEELLMEMKSDVSRLPSELSKIPSVSTQLKMDEISTISKAAHKEATPVVNSSGSRGNRSGSVIAHTPEVITTTVTPPIGGEGAGGASVISDGLKQPHSVAQRSSSPRHRRTAAEDKVSVVTGNAIATATPPAVVPATATAAPATAPVAYAATAAGSTIQLPAGQLLQTADGLVVYQGVQSSGNVAAQKTATIVQQATPTATQSSNNAQTYAIGVPTYVDGSGGAAAAAVYLQGQTVQLVQVSGGQQVVYCNWPSVVQGGQAGSTTQAGTQIAVLSTDANGAPVITID